MNRLIFLIAIAGAICAQPSIDAGSVLNTSGSQPDLAPGVVWLIYGKNLGPATLTTATGPNYPDSLAGTSVTFTPVSGGAAVNARIWYTLATQVGGLIPSSLAPGAYNVRVTYNSQTSAPVSVNVVARSMGIATSNGQGNGPAQATIANVNGGLSLVRYTSGTVDFGGNHWILTPSHPGDHIILWGTGGGPDPANDAGGSSGDQTAAGNFVVNVGTRQITPEYAGTSSGYPGLWQINFVLPTDIDLDCFAPVRVSANGNPGNLTSIAIAAPGQTACSDSQFSLPLLTKLDSGQDIIDGVFAVAKITGSGTGTVQETVSGFFGRYTSTTFVLPRIAIKFGPCEIFDRTFPATAKDPASPYAFLDAGTRLPISGANFPAGSGLAATITALGPSYTLIASSGTLTPGTTYTMTGSGGSVVGAFSATTPFALSFQSSSWDALNAVDRTKPLTFTWTGTGFDQVYIQVNSALLLGANRRIVTMNCTVPAAAGSYTIPTAALAYMPPVPGSGTSFGNLALEAHQETPFKAPLVGGGQIDIGIFASNLGFTKNVAIQ
jgi:uncharacterized protein (TIGR03437 family)